MRERIAREWVVYQSTIGRNLPGSLAICSQDEWPAIRDNTAISPVLIQERIGNEGEAERLIRTLQTQAGDARGPVPAKVKRPRILAIPPVTPLAESLIPSFEIATTAAIAVPERS
jgi:hypothetical protein